MKAQSDPFPKFHHPELIDAQRLRDNTAIMLKRVTLSPESQELYLAHSLCSRDAVYADDRNHCVPVFKILDVPEDPYEFILVMPLLSRWYHPEFDTIGEVLEFCRQIFEVHALSCCATEQITLTRGCNTCTAEVWLTSKGQISPVRTGFSLLL